MSETRHQSKLRKKLLRQQQKLLEQVSRENGVVRYEHGVIERDILEKSTEKQQKDIKPVLCALESNQRLARVLDDLNPLLHEASTTKVFFKNLKPRRLKEIEEYLNAQIIDLVSAARRSGQPANSPTLLFNRIEAASGCWQALIECIPSAATLLCDIKEIYDRRVIQHVIKLERACVDRVQVYLDARTKHLEAQQQLVPLPKVVVTTSNNISPPTRKPSSPTQGGDEILLSPNKRRYQVEQLSGTKIPRKPVQDVSRMLLSPRRKRLTMETKRGSWKPDLQQTTRKTLIYDVLPSRLMIWLEECLDQINKKDTSSLVFEEVYSILSICMHQLILGVTRTHRKLGNTLLNLWNLLIKLFTNVAKVRKRSLDKNAKEELKLLNTHARLSERLSTTSAACENLVIKRKNSISREIAHLQKTLRATQSAFDVEKMKVLLLQSTIERQKQKEVQMRRQGVALMNKRLVKKIVRLAAENEEIGDNEDIPEDEKRETQTKLEEELEKHKSLQKEMAFVFSPAVRRGSATVGQLRRASLCLVQEAAEKNCRKDLQELIASAAEKYEQRDYAAAAAAAVTNQVSVEERKRKDSPLRQAITLSATAIEEEISTRVKYAKAKEQVRERRREELERKNRERDAGVLLRVTNILDASLEGLETLTKEHSEMSIRVHHRDACVQVQEDIFQVKVVQPAKKTWMLNRKTDVWALKKNNDGDKRNPFIPPEFVDLLKHIPVAFKPKLLTLAETRSLATSIYTRHFGEEYLDVLNRLTLYMETIVKDDTANALLINMRKKLAPMPSKQSLLRQNTMLQKASFLHRKETINRLISSTNPADRLSGANKEHGLRWFICEHFLNHNIDNKSTSKQPSRRTTADTSKDEHGMIVNAEKDTLNFLCSLKEHGGQCFWVSCLDLFIENSSNVVSFQSVRNSFSSSDMAFLEAVLCALTGRVQSPNTNPLVERKTDGSLYLPLEMFEALSPYVDCLFTEEQIEAVNNHILENHSLDLKLNDKEYKIPANMPRKGTSTIELIPAIEYYFTEHTRVKRLIIERLCCLFSAANFSQDGILTYDQFVTVVRATNSNLSKMEMNQMYKFASRLGNNSQTIEMLDFVDAAFKFNLLVPREWNKSEIGIPVLAKVDGIDIFKECEDEDDYYDDDDDMGGESHGGEEELSQQIESLSALWEHHLPETRARLDALVQESSTVQEQRLVVYHKQRLEYCKTLLEHCSTSRRSCSQSDVSTTWFAFWLLRFALLKAQKGQQYATTLGSVRMLMRWKLRMREILGGVDGASMFGTAAKQITEANRNKPEKKKLHPAFSKCRWHRTGQLMALLDGENEEYPEPFPINDVDDCGNSLLHIAVQNGHVDYLQILIERGVDVNLQNNTGQTAMHFAKFYDHKRIFFMLRRAGANDQIRNKAGLTCHQVEKTLHCNE